MSEAAPVPAAPVAAPAPSAPARPTGRFELPADPVVPAPAAPAADAPSVQNTEAQAPSAEPEDKPEEVTPELAAKREGRRFERKLDKAYRQRAEAQAHAALLEKQLAEARQQPAHPQQKAEGEPTLEQFDYDPEKYATAKAEYAKKLATQEFTAKQRDAAGKAARERLTTAWEEKVERGSDKYEDWSSVVGELKPDTPFTTAIMKAANGDDVAHYLGKNPKEIQRITQLEPIEQVLEIGLLAAKLQAKPVEPKAPSKAPAPITPLTGASPVSSDKPSEADDMKNWMRKRQKQVHGR